MESRTGLQTCLIMPALYSETSPGTVLKWAKVSTENVQRDEILVLIETERLLVELSAPASGQLTIHVAEGMRVSPNTVLCTINRDNALPEAQSPWFRQQQHLIDPFLIEAPPETRARDQTFKIYDPASRGRVTSGTAHPDSLSADYPTPTADVPIPTITARQKDATQNHQAHRNDILLSLICLIVLVTPFVMMFKQLGPLWGRIAVIPWTVAFIVGTLVLYDRKARNLMGTVLGATLFSGIVAGVVYLLYQATVFVLHWISEHWGMIVLVLLGTMLAIVGCRLLFNRLRWGYWSWD